MQRNVVLALALLFGLATVAQANPVVNMGNYTFAANSGVHTIQIMVSNDPGTGPFNQVVVGDLNWQIEDGSATAGFPTFAAPIDAKTGTIFGAGAAYVQGLTFQDAGQQFWVMSPGTSPISAVIANLNGSSLLATVQIGTTGALGGIYNLFATGTNNGDSDWGNPDIDVTSVWNNGTITITVPEPTSIVMGLFAAAGLGAVAIRKRRARRA